jgi:hypothetical protein
MNTNITIELPDDDREAVRILRDELRAARRRLARTEERTAFSRFRDLPLAGSPLARG